VFWYLTGQPTSLARADAHADADNERADLNLMTVGALITFSVGLVAAIAT